MLKTRPKRITTTISMNVALLLPSMTWASEVQFCVEQAVLVASGDTSLASIRQQCESNHSQAGNAESNLEMTECLRQRANTAGIEALVSDLKAECAMMTGDQKQMPEKFIADRKVEADPYVLLPLRQNYILPYTYNDSPNQTLYQIPGNDALIQESEAKLQISLKAPVTFGDLLTANDGIYLGFTLKSFWQVYNDDISAPFRETNYRPEIFYATPLLITSASGSWFGRIGLEHESNGRAQYLSRSWNRAYVTLSYAQANWGVSIQPWHRFAEETKLDDGDPATPPPPKGDDNPDINDYMGHYEITGAYKWNQLEFSGLFRRNFAEGKGAHELGVSFPLYGRLRGYVQYFEGFGESLIDYNHKNQRIGVGILLSDLI